MNSGTARLNPVPAVARHRIGRAVGLALLWFVIALLTLWALAALYVDCRMAVLRIPLAVLYVVGIVVALARFKLTLRAAASLFAGFCIVLVWWLSLKPSNEGDWQENATRTTWAEVNGDRVTIHNLRNCDYRTEDEYSNCWSDRIVNLSDLRALDFFFTTWGPTWIGHPIVSFQFGDHDHVAFSIEARYKVGQSYSAVLGFFRQYELIFIAADERDVVRLRTNFRKDEEVRLYRTRVSPQASRAIFLAYIQYLNKLRAEPEWYNALTRNCTTAIDAQIAQAMHSPLHWNYQLLLNGTLDHLLYERGRLVTGGLPFEELRKREHINAAAHAADNSADFSDLIRVGRVGF